MVARDLKYLLSYMLPLTTIYGILEGGLRSYSTVILAFCLIPLFEIFVPKWKDNFSDSDQGTRSKILFFDVLLFLNILWVYGIIVLFALTLKQNQWSTFEWVGQVFSLGIMLGSNGINVAHELGHKSGKIHQIAAQLLLWPSFYVHFTTEHNYGHHVKVGTPEDPATARKGEWVYTFWLRSIFHGFSSAWALKNKQADQSYGIKKIWAYPMVSIFLWPLLYPLLLILLGDLFLFTSLMLAAVISILLLETINYIEHYGLLRDRTPTGMYVPVNMMHSWNSNHEIGRVVLYELTRHSDHHYKAYKKYQNLNHYDESPQLPLGYPGSILLSLFPPLWFAVMHPLLDQWKKKISMHEANH